MRKHVTTTSNTHTAAAKVEHHWLQGGPPTPFIFQAAHDKLVTSLHLLTRLNGPSADHPPTGATTLHTHAEGVPHKQCWQTISLRCLSLSPSIACATPPHAVMHTNHVSCNQRNGSCISTARNVPPHFCHTQCVHHTTNTLLVRSHVTIMHVHSTKYHNSHGTVVHSSQCLHKACNEETHGVILWPV